MEDVWRLLPKQGRLDGKKSEPKLIWHGVLLVPQLAKVVAEKVLKLRPVDPLPYKLVQLLKLVVAIIFVFFLIIFIEALLFIFIRLLLVTPLT